MGRSAPHPVQHHAPHQRRRTGGPFGERHRPEGVSEEKRCLTSSFSAWEPPGESAVRSLHPVVVGSSARPLGEVCPTVRMTARVSDRRRNGASSGGVACASPAPGWLTGSVCGCQKNPVNQKDEPVDNFHVRLGTPLEEQS